MKPKTSTVWLFLAALIPGGLSAQDAQILTPPTGVSLASFERESRGDSIDCGNCDGWGDGSGRDGGPEESYVLPRWTVTADALFLDRRTPSGAVLVANTQNPAEFLDASSLNFPFQAGWDLSLARHLDCDHAVEVRYFAVDQWNTTTTSATTSGDQLVINTAIPVFTLAGTSVDANASSRLHSFELNGRRRVGDYLTVLAGVRYLEVDEHLGFTMTNSIVPFTYDAVARNRLYGAQIGGDVTLWDRGGPLSVSGVGKAGVYGNRAGQDSTYTTGLVTLPSSGGTSLAAFVGEVGVTGTLRLTDHFAVRTGYRVLWVDGVALATNQVAASEFVFGQGIDAKGDTMYHGAFVGVEYTR